jgi:F-type H+-transporting ATPase subunit delta
MKIPRKARKDAKRLFQTCLVEARLNEDRVRQSMRLLIEQRPRNYLPILRHFARLVGLELHRRQATIDSAVALAPDLQAAVQGSLTRQHGEGLLFVHREDAALIGGLRVQVGDTVFDGSIRARLNDLKDRF